MEYCGALANFALWAVHRPTAIAAWNFPAILMHFRLFNPLETARDGTFQQALGTADALTSGVILSNAPRNSYQRRSFTKVSQCLF
jgi:hypothetical protein